MYYGSVDEAINTALADAQTLVNGGSHIKTASHGGQAVAPQGAHTEPAYEISNGTTLDLCQKLAAASLGLQAGASGGVEVERMGAEDPSGGDDGHVATRTPVGTQQPNSTYATAHTVPPAATHQADVQAKPAGDRPETTVSEQPPDPAIARTVDDPQPPAPEGVPPMAAHPPAVTEEQAEQQAMARKAAEEATQAKIANLINLFGEDHVSLMMRKEAYLAQAELHDQMEKQAKGQLSSLGKVIKKLSPESKILGSAGIAAGLAGAGLIGARIANQDEPEIAATAFGQGYDIGQEQTANAIYDAISTGT